MTPIAVRVKRLQNQHCLWVTAVAAVIICLSAADDFGQGKTTRAAALLCTLPTQLWVMFRAHRQAISAADIALSLATSFCSLCITTWTVGGVDNPRTVAALGSFLPGLIAQFGFVVVKPACLVLTLFLVITTTVENTIGLERFTLVAQPELRPLLSISIFLAITFFFVFLIARVTSKQSQWLLEATDREKAARKVAERFLSNMSHEVRNPLNGIQGLLEQIRVDSPDAQCQSNASLALSVSRQLHAIVNDILDYQKLEAGKLVISRDCFGVDGLRLALNRDIHTAGSPTDAISYNLALSDAVPDWVFGDQNRVFQVIVNVLSNAFKFTESGQVSVSEDYVANSGLYRLTISDTGIGMSEETLSRLFDRFHQASEGYAKHRQGTGLGLAISKQLVDLMGGSLTASSSLGVGSTFTLTLPLPGCTPLQHAPSSARLGQHSDRQFPAHTQTPTMGTTPEPRNQTDTGTQLSGLRLLCVDDDLINLKVMKAPLARAGATVYAASSAKEAMTILSDTTVDLVFTDISMPEVDGTELKRWITEHFPSLPVVAVTGNSLNEDVNQFKALGFVGVLPKPYQREDLLKIAALVTRDRLAPGTT